MTSPPSEFVAEILRRPRAVIGTGTQGRRIALMLASQGGEVRIYGRSAGGREEAKSFVEKNLADIARQIGGTPAHIVLCDSMDAAVANVGLAIEAVPEQLELKRDIFGTLDRLAPVDAVLASNSSSYPSSQIIEGLTHPERVLNAHFYMPPLQNAVELMSCGATRPEIINALMDVLPRFGLEPYHVQRESIGFIFNRIWAAIKREFACGRCGRRRHPQGRGSHFPIGPALRRGAVSTDGQSRIGCRSRHRGTLRGSERTRV